MGIEEKPTVVEPIEQEEVETPIIEEVETNEETQTPTEDNIEEEGDLVVSFGDEETPPQDNEQQEAPEWVKELRERQRETAKENKRLKKELEEINGAKKQKETLTLGEKPTLESSDYDEDKFSQDLEEYHVRKRAIEKQEEANQEEVKTQQQKAQQIFENYVEKKEALKVKDYDDVETNVVETLSVDQQNVILSVAVNPALLVYAIGKNDSKLKELSEIKDPIKFAATVARLETTMKSSNRRTAPKPETKVKGSGGGSLLNTGDAKLQKLREEANKSGDISKVLAYKKELKNNKG